MIAVCQLDSNFQTPLGKYWNLGPTVEVTDAEIMVIAKALELVPAALEKPVTCHIFSDS